MSEQEKRDNAAAKESVSSDKKAKAPKKKDKKPNRVLRWLKDLRGELKKVTWPSKKDLIRQSTVVVVFVLILTVLVGLIDTGLSALLKLIIS